MSFLHVSLLAGLGLAAVPILLHLLSKKQPKRIAFPALRFVRQTAVVAERGWRIRHWLLLVLRVLLLGLLAFLFAGPRVHGDMLATAVSLGMVIILAVLATFAALLAVASRRPRRVIIPAATVAGVLWLISLGWTIQTALGGKAAPVQASTGPIAAAIVVDTSPTMDYRSNNESRLELAKSLATWLIDRMPPQSQIAILAGEQNPRLGADPVTAKRQLDRVLCEGLASPIPERVRKGIELVRKSDLERREVYILSDLMAGPWREADQAALPSLLVQDPRVLVQIIDVGLEKTENWSLVQGQALPQVTLPGGTVELQALIVASELAPSNQLNVDLLSEPIDRTLPVLRNGKMVTPQPQVVSRQIIDIKSGEKVPVTFRLRDLAEGTHHLYLRLTRPDPLGIDNQMHLTVDARPQGKTLVVGEDAVAMNALRLLFSPIVETESLEGTAELVSPFRLDVANFEELACVCLYDPPSLTNETVKKLMAFVENGGSLLIILGARFESADALRMAPLASLLPGQPMRITRRPEDDRSLYWAPVRDSHPIFFPLEDQRLEAPWSRYAVHRHWDLEGLADNAQTLIRYTTNGKPAIIEQSIGKGRIVTLTTPYPESTQPEGRAPWNDLFTTIDPWETFGVMRGIAQYLSGWGKDQFNYSVGQLALLDNDPFLYPDRYELFTPTSEVVRTEVVGGNIRYPYTRYPGHYRLRGLKNEQPVVRGFSIQIAQQDLGLERISQANLDLALGAGQFRVARDRANIESSIGQARFGQELYPFVLLVLAAMVLGEQAMSAGFYGLATEAQNRKAQNRKELKPDSSGRMQSSAP
jgi:hypothetical protein